MRRLFYLVLMLGFFACNEEEFITQRGYAFVESIGVSDIDETGVSVDFEITKNGDWPITEYGVEFVKAGDLNLENPTYSVVKESGVPGSSLISIRISSDLVDKTDYLARPFVKSGKVVAYGENLVFRSKGVSPPVISSVTPTQFFVDSRIVVIGENFNTRFEENSIEVLNSEDYIIQIDSVFSQRIVFSISVKYSSKATENQNLRLKLTSGGKTIQFPSEITSIVPRILEMNPKSIYVGDDIEVKYSYPISFSSYSLRLNNNEDFDISYLAFDHEVESTIGSYTVLGGRPGTYIPYLESAHFPVEFPEQPIEILPTWETYQENVKLPDWRYNTDYRVGDYLLMFSHLESGEIGLQKLEIGQSSPQLINNPSFMSVDRFYGLGGAAGDRYLYYGLGRVNNDGVNVSSADFGRLDVQSGQWEQLADFPFEYTQVHHSFFYKGKLYVVMTNYLNFRVYDPVTNEWSMSPIQVPDEVRNGKGVQVNGVLYFLYNDSGESRIYTYDLGTSATFFTKVSSEAYSVYNTSLGYTDNHLLYMSQGAPISKIDIHTKKERPLQTVFPWGRYSFMPWSNSRGFFLILPVSDNTHEMENTIYRLIQDF